MPQLAYTFYTTFTDSSLADEWLRWLRDGHVAEVMNGGATDAEIIELDAPPDALSGTRAFEVRYHFASRADFARYEKDHAPRLRAEGLKLFPVERGVSYRRAVGTVLTRTSR
jgi:hypothetical protein